MNKWQSYILAMALLGFGVGQSQAAIYLGQDTSGHDWTFLEKRIVNKGHGYKESWAFIERGNDKRKVLYSFNCNRASVAQLAVDDYKVARGRTDRLIHSWRPVRPSYYQIGQGTFEAQMYYIAC